VTRISVDAQEEHWTPPDGLSTAVPRAVKMRDSYKIQMAVSSAISIAPILFAYFFGKLPIIAVVLCYFFFVSILVLLMLLAYTRERYLLRWGGVAPARMKAENQTQRRGMSSTKYLAVAYSFTDKDGNIIETQTSIRADNRPASIEVRNRILDKPTVLYDPKDSSRNILYPPSTVELAD
jgi:hypothetical protein